ncbi:IS481 family transposase [Micromonospora sp. NPDC049559]|uniref:IS481 family transposase n=1 Tax=Micromonospora sp. NPDC049559 TaxID=3155923 RepID=UPI00343F6CBD
MVGLSVVEQRYQAVLAVLAGDRVTEVAARFRVSRQSVHAWLGRYAEEGLAGLEDRSRRPESCPHQASPEVQAAVCELRRAHPRWGARRIVFELGRAGCPAVPSRMSVYRILARHGLVEPVKRRRGRKDYRRWQRAAPMELWQMDIVGGAMLADGSEAKVVTGVDDHSRYCVIARVVRRATGRAVCEAFARGMAEFGVPQEMLTDNGKQFTDRFGKGGEVLFDRICRENGIVHRLTQPASPTTTGKVERFHQTLRRELLDEAGLFTDLEAAQAAIDVFRDEYNTRRPHQSLDMAFPADRFTPAIGGEGQRLVPLKLPNTLAATVADPHLPPPVAPVGLAPADPAPVVPPPVPVGSGWVGEAVEFDRVVPPSGNMQVSGKQFWLGPARSGVTVTFWADTDVVHLMIAGTRLKSCRSHLSVTDLAALLRDGGRRAGPPPLPPAPAGQTPGPVEVDRTVGSSGCVSLGQHMVLAAEILAGRRVGVRVDEHTLSFFDPETRELLRTRPNPFTPAEVARLRSARPAGPPPQPRTDPVRVQRRASNSGTIMVVGQKIALGRIHARKTITIDVTDTELAIHCDDGTRTIRRTTTDPVIQTKAQRPRIRNGDHAGSQGISRRRHTGMINS